MSQPAQRSQVRHDGSPDFTHDELSRQFFVAVIRSIGNDEPLVLIRIDCGPANRCIVISADTNHFRAQVGDRLHTLLADTGMHVNLAGATK